MPFLVLPRSHPPSEGRLDALAARLCPYDAAPSSVSGSSDYTVWATSLAAVEHDRVTSSLSTGTARFELCFEGDSLRVATDPLGTCPVWYARLGDRWVVSAEAKALAPFAPVTLRPEEELLAAGPRAPDWTPFEDVSRLPPGTTLRLIADRAVVEGRPIEFRMGTEALVGRDWARELGEMLLASFRPSEELTASFVSGGIDSSIACALARRHGPVSTFSLGTAYGDEFAGARSLTEALDCRHREVHLGGEEMRRELDRVVLQNEVFDGLTAEILVQLAFLHRAARELGTRVTTGYGSDLLFDGMLRHRAYLEAVGLHSTPELIERTRWTGELAPFVHWSLGISAEHVFWNARLIEFALRIPRDACWVEGVEKHVLREAAVRSSLLPRELAFRPKVGLTDGTGANRLLSEVLGIDDPYGYREKSRACIERLRHAIRA